jgi:hypothetical protein
VQTRHPAAALGESPALTMRGAGVLRWNACGARDGVASVRVDCSQSEGPRQMNGPSSARRQHVWRTVDTTPHDTGRAALCREPRSTPKWACFTTSAAAMPTSAAREVTLYLAVASPSSSRPCSSGPAVSSWLTLHRARRRSSAGPVHGPSEHRLRVPFGSRKPVAELHGRDPDVDHRTECLVVLHPVPHRRDVTLADSIA